MTKNINLVALLTLSSLLSCHDTRSFEHARNVKHGMSIKEVEQSMGEPMTYDYVNDSTEIRKYIYDNAGNGLDKRLEITYENEKVIDIRDGHN